MRRVTSLSHCGRDDRRHLGSGSERGLCHADFTTAQGIIAVYQGRFIVIIVSIVILRTAYYMISKVFNIPSEARSWRKKIALGDKGKTVAPLLKNLLKYCIIFVAGWWCSVSGS